jgi:mannose-6-phosphate isomerase-like protein (cupin superfamily)
VKVSEQPLQTTTLGEKPDDIAPDGSEIRNLPRTVRGSLCHCTLTAGKTSLPVSHHNIEEIWFVLNGQGEVWRKNSRTEVTVPMIEGASFTIPPHTSFQFRNTGDGPLSILIATMPPWPGPQEAEAVEGVWAAE